MEVCLSLRLVEMIGDGLRSGGRPWLSEERWPGETDGDRLGIGDDADDYLQCVAVLYVCGKSYQNDHL